MLGTMKKRRPQISKRLLVYLGFNITGIALIPISPWLVLLSLYVAPVFRFGYWASFSLLIADCTFGTEDGGLHMAGGPLLYLLLSPAVAIDYLLGKSSSKPSELPLPPPPAPKEHP